METRNITQVRVFVLVLNDMRFPKIEMGRIVAVSTSYEKLVELYNSNKAESQYSENVNDYNWNKTFKKDSVLEWYNPVYSLELNYNDEFGHGIHDEWLDMEKWEYCKSNNSISSDVLIIEE